MKRILSFMLAAACVIILNTKTVIAQDTKPDIKKKTEKHIRLLKVDENGKKTEIDTVITGDAPFVWNGDTIGGEKEFKWITRGDFTMDSIHKFDYKIEGDGKQMIIMHKGMNNSEGFMIPPVPPVPHLPKVMMLNRNRNKNVIDLNDPGIISYDKKVRKDGTEKITIVRKQVSDDVKMEEDVFIHAPGGVPAKVGFHPLPGEKVKTVKVVKSDDGTINIFENENVDRVKGQKIRLKEIKEGIESKVEVEIEDEKENK